MQVITYKFRLKDGGNKRKYFLHWSESVNFVWNYCNEASYQTLKKYSKWLSVYELMDLTSGVSKDLKINSQVIQQVCREYTQKRYQFKRQRLSWRKSHGSRRSLGWIPCTNQNVKISKNVITFCKHKFKFWNTRTIKGSVRSISFNEDSRGRWYINIMCAIASKDQNGKLELGVDLGCKTQATLSDGRKFERENLTRKYKERLAMAQRAGKKKLARNIHTKIANIRKDWNHKTANAILKDAALVVVGDVNSSKLAKTHLAKSVLDAGWYQLKSFLIYKSNLLGTTVKEVNESWTSRVCNVCGEIGEHKGLSGLSVREWECKSCGTLHDRDINAARNILRIGHDTPIKGIPGL